METKLWLYLGSTKHASIGMRWFVITQLPLHFDKLSTSLMNRMAWEAEQKQFKLCDSVTRQEWPSMEERKRGDYWLEQEQISIVYKALLRYNFRTKPSSSYIIIHISITRLVLITFKILYNLLVMVMKQTSANDEQHHRWHDTAGHTFCPRRFAGISSWRHCTPFQQLSAWQQLNARLVWNSLQGRFRWRWPLVRNTFDSESNRLSKVCMLKKWSQESWHENVKMLEPRRVGWGIPWRMLQVWRVPFSKPDTSESSTSCTQRCHLGHGEARPDERTVVPSSP